MTLTRAEARPVRILLVEDSPADAKLTQIALQRARVANQLFVARDGVEALEFLRGAGEFGSAPFPDLVLLDLNLPKKNGQEVLAEIKADPGLRRVPVVVLTTSADDADVVRSYDLAASAYVRKPVDFDRFIEVIRSIEGFWLQVVQFPPVPEGRR